MDGGRVVSIVVDASVFVFDLLEIVVMYVKCGVMSNVEWYCVVNVLMDIFLVKFFVDFMEVLMGCDNLLFVEFGLFLYSEAVKNIYRL